jgi:hypothetical protein
MDWDKQRDRAGTDFEQIVTQLSEGRTRRLNNANTKVLACSGPYRCVRFNNRNGE